MVEIQSIRLFLITLPVMSQNYVRGQSKDCGEVYSLAYAAYHNMNYFCSKEIMVDNVAHELEDLKDIDIITFDIILLSAYVYYAEKNDNSNSKGLKSMYKKYCADGRIFRCDRLVKDNKFLIDSVYYQSEAFSLFADI